MAGERRRNLHLPYRLPRLFQVYEMKGIRQAPSSHGGFDHLGGGEIELSGQSAAKPAISLAGRPRRGPPLGAREWPGRCRSISHAIFLARTADRLLGPVSPRHAPPRRGQGGTGSLHEIGERPRISDLRSASRYLVRSDL